jgi:catechol 2,3-dioxygenase-like lactoylglutathione lyase family enzyme
MSESNRPWSLTGLHHIGLTVRDIEASIQFYRDTLGFEMIGRRPRVTADYISKQTGYCDVEMSVASFKPTPDSIQSLEVVQYLTQNGEPSDQSTNRPGNSHICFLVDDFMSCYEELKSKGVRFKSDPVHITAGPNEGGLVVYFLDPDGHPLEMFQPPKRDDS